MKNIIYGKVIIPITKAEDGETPTAVYVTKETNGYSIFVKAYDLTSYREFIHFFPLSERTEAVEFGVLMAIHMKDVFNATQSTNTKHLMGHFWKEKQGVGNGE